MPRGDETSGGDDTGNVVDLNKAGTKVPQSSMAELKKAIRQARDEIDEVMKERELQNETLGEIKDRMEKKGISRRVLMRAYKDWKQDAEKRAKEEREYLIAREAMGVPLQTELFGS